MIENGIVRREMMLGEDRWDVGVRSLEVEWVDGNEEVVVVMKMVVEEVENDMGGRRDVRRIDGDVGEEIV